MRGTEPWGLWEAAAFPGPHGVAGRLVGSFLKPEWAVGTFWAKPASCPLEYSESFQKTLILPGTQDVRCTAGGEGSVSLRRSDLPAVQWVWRQPGGGPPPVHRRWAGRG